ncbi:hypothetical protein XAB3213_4580003 [Xanthomonas citri pv. bilvae]|nr:hypothetical protein XAB3213_4580003 [Xanthomonas citri pv. bilvae]
MRPIGRARGYSSAYPNPMPIWVGKGVFHFFNYDLHRFIHIMAKAILIGGASRVVKISEFGSMRAQRHTNEKSQGKNNSCQLPFSGKKNCLPHLPSH